MTACVHRWLLEPPGGRFVKAVCRRCGVTRDLPAAYEGPESAWDPGPRASAKVRAEQRKRLAAMVRPVEFENE